MPVSLAPPLTPFIGRQDDLQALQALLQEPSTRLITLVGTGGIGKPRLALELLARQREDAADAAIFVPLAQLSSVEAILPTLAEQLGISSPPSGDLRQAVLDHLSSRKCRL